jgi:DNA-binding NtrC family response regulator
MKRRILLADDELAILLTLKAILEVNGFEVETASSAREAKEKLRNSTFDMVITDMWMESETSGLEVIRAARRQPYNPATAILTAYPNLGANQKDASAESLLVKPMNTGDLLRQLEALLVAHADNKAQSERESSGDSSEAAPVPRPPSKSVPRQL